MTSARETGTIRIVLCDDVAELRRILREVLEENPGVEVVDEAGTGRECVRIVAERRPDVVLLDLSMPDMDGLEALPLIAQASPGTRIVVFSGFAADRMGGLVLERGADLYLEKGVPLDALADAVFTLVRGDGPAPDASSDGGGRPDGGGQRLMAAPAGPPVWRRLLPGFSAG
jgi:DNA-binding NarL/FixJ family response regulator